MFVKLGMIKEFGFQEITIHSSYHLAIFWIKAPIPFLVYPVPNKDTLNGTWRKFGTFMFWNVNKYRTAKDTRRKG